MKIKRVKIGDCVLFHGDCLDIMPKLPENKIDLILCDLPYGTTACAWDTIIPFDAMWTQYARLAQTTTPIVLTSSQPFTSALVMSNIKRFRYQWIWNKIIPSGMSYARFQPMRQHEDILVFCEGRVPYNPQMIQRYVSIKEGGKKKSQSAPIANFNSMSGKIYNTKNPTTLIEFSKVRQGSVHPTQKPVALMAYLIKTYTNEQQLVMDNCMGSGTTGVACVETNRKFVGIEQNKEYFEISCDRINEAHKAALYRARQGKLFKKK